MADMGMIRKALFAGTIGVTAPYSKRERAEKRLLAATLGKSEAEVRRTGTRRGVFDRYQDPGPGRDAENRGAAEEYQRQHDLARYGVSGRAPKRASEEDA